MELDAKTIHVRAEEVREKEGDFLEALVLTDRATVAYQKEGDVAGVAEVQSSRFLTFRHLYEQTGDRNYLILAKYAVMSSVEIARNSGKKEALAIPLLNLAKSHYTLGEFKQAIPVYKEALSTLPDSPHNRPAVAGDIRVRLAICEYKTGDKNALERAEKAIEEIAGADEVRYNKDVWVSGGHMEIAEMLRKDNPTKAKEHLSKAKKIIDDNSDLKLRKKQWDKLEETFRE